MNCNGGNTSQIEAVIDSENQNIAGKQKKKKREYMVDEIIDHGYSEDGSLKLKIRWSNNSVTWEPQHFTNIVSKYHFN